MLLQIEQPAMALNSASVPGPKYKMWNTRTIQTWEPPDWILRNVASVADSAPNHYLNFLVLNCHGSPASLGLGKGTGPSQTKFFSVLRGKVSTILIVACRVAEGKVGNDFCSQIAQESWADVYAPVESQDTGIFSLYLPYGCIDGFEGDVWHYKPDGSYEVSDL